MLQEEMPTLWIELPENIQTEAQSVMNHILSPGFFWSVNAAGVLLLSVK